MNDLDIEVLVNKENITGYNFEPWHFRYVGKNLAKHLYDNDYTLEEYYQKIKVK